MKRAVAVLILSTMVLHCSSRLGFISYLYSQRHAIAFNVGLVGEIPISTCGNEYFAEQAPLTIQDQKQTDRSLPVQYSQAKEINLFIEHISKFVTVDADQAPGYNNRPPLSFYPSPALPVFHPPCEG